MSSSSPRTGNVRIAFRLRPRQDQEQDEYGCVHVTPDRGRVALRSNEETHHFTLDRVRCVGGVESYCPGRLLLLPCDVFVIALSIALPNAIS